MSDVKAILLHVAPILNWCDIVIADVNKAADEAGRGPRIAMLSNERGAYLLLDAMLKEHGIDKTKS